MSVRFFYVDESYDNNKFCLSAISIRHTDWKDCFDLVKQHRQYLKDTYGVFLRKEIHAQELVRGGGRIAPHLVGKWERSRIFLSMLHLVAHLPNVWIFNICLDTNHFPDPQLAAWDRLINRVERTMRKMEEDELPLRRGLIKNIHSDTEEGIISSLKSRLMIFRSRAVMFADEGRETEITKAIRKMHVINHIPSQFGDWGGGSFTKNIVTERIVEDPIFKQSHRSYFVQLADCVAFALLKREVPPTRNVQKYRIHTMFDQALPSVCFRPASPKDPLGIVRK